MIDQLLMSKINTPIGELLFVFDEEGYLYATDWADYEERMRRLLKLYHSPNLTLHVSNDDNQLAISLREYFDGNIKAIDNIECRSGGTKFQKEVWNALRSIPVGQTMSYGELARKINRPQAVRAVGAANGANPISVVVPCHRVIGANGSLTGYAGGIERKRWLLQHEAIQLNFELTIN